jgi:8-oxo-dGTP pyrophosphatase MutT (NUDIX family)
MAVNVVPRPASTVLTLRDANNGYEILMLRRNERSTFMPGAYVFPGGTVEGDDAAADIAFGLSDEVASARLSVESGGRAYYVAALRELFEESGLLVACTSGGDEVSFLDPNEAERLSEQRRALNAGELRFVDMMRERALLINLSGVAYLAHWITPAGLPRRYDTRFFVVLAPTGQRATHDAGETVADRWIRPSDALAAHVRGDMEIMFPTLRTLEAIAHFHTVHEVISYARSLGPVATVNPILGDRAGTSANPLPDDEGFNPAERGE